jgi:protein-tyrosine kinase
MAPAVQAVTAADAIGAFATPSIDSDEPGTAPAWDEMRQGSAPERFAAIPSENAADADPLRHSSHDHRMVTSPGLDPIAAQQYERLAGTLHQLQIERRLRSVLVTSSIGAEGKSLTAANLALTLAQSFGRRVMLIDADLRRPSLAAIFGTQAKHGLSTVLAEGSPPVASLVRLSDRLGLLTAGPACSDPIGMLTSSRMQQLLEDAVETFDWVIIDSPPAAFVSDAALLGNKVDGILLVVQAGSTPLASVQRAIAALPADRIIGAVLNQAEKGTLADYRYYDGDHGHTSYAAPADHAAVVT